MTYNITSNNQTIGQAPTLAAGISKMIKFAATSHRFNRLRLIGDGERLCAFAECINYNADTMEARVSVRDCIACSLESYEVKIVAECTKIELTDVETQRAALVSWAAS